MKEHLRDEWGLKTLDENEMQTNGGISLRELWLLLNMLGDAIKKAEKYWPAFKDGFQAGWEEA